MGSIYLAFSHRRLAPLKQMGWNKGFCHFAFSSHFMLTANAYRHSHSTKLAQRMIVLHRVWEMVGFGALEIEKILMEPTLF